MATHEVRLSEHTLCKVSMTAKKNPKNLQKSDIRHPAPFAPSGQLVNHETVWLRNFISKQTKQTYQAVFREFCQLGQITEPEKLRQVSSADIIAYRDHLIDEKGMRPRSVRNRLAAISSLFKHLKNEQVVMLNPVENIKRPQVDQERGATPAMTITQVAQMLATPNRDTVAGARDSAILHLLFFTGCRISEPAKLKVKDLYEDEGYSMLRFTVKGGKQKSVEVHHELRHALDRYLSLANHGDYPESPLFLAVKGGNNSGAPLSRQQYTNIFTQYRIKAGLPASYSPHSARDMRHDSAQQRRAFRGCTKHARPCRHPYHADL